MCLGLQGPISGERRHPRAPRGAYFEHLSNTSSTQVLDCSNTSSCQSNSRPYPGNPGLTLEPNPWCCRCCRAVGLSGFGCCRVVSDCRGVSGLSGHQPCKRTHVLTDIWLSELSGCRAVGWCRGCRGGVRLVSNDIVSGCQATPQGAAPLDLAC